MKLGRLCMRDYFLKKAWKSGAELNWNNYWRLCNKATKMIQKENGQFYKNKLQVSLNSHKSFWDVINDICPAKKDELKSPECVKTSEGICKDKYNIPHHFNQFFINAVYSLSGYFNPTSNTTYMAGEASPTNYLTFLQHPSCLFTNNLKVSRQQRQWVWIRSPLDYLEIVLV